MTVSRIGVVTDSTADFPNDVQERLGIVVVPLSVIWDRDTFRDKVDLSTADFYRLLRERATVPTTSAPPAGLFEQTYEDLLGQVDHVISVHLAGKLSATFDVARSAAERVGQGRVTAIDSGTTTMCLGWLAARAVELGATGAAPEQIAADLRGLVPRLRLYAALDTLEYALKGGRIGRAKALLGSILNFKPILSIRENEVLPVERPRSRSSAMRRLVDIIAAQGALERIGVLNGGIPDVMDELERLVHDRLPGVPIDRGEIGIVLGTHAGPVFGLTAIVAS
ncbi:MAG: DegV family protein [Chloroflexi bacterium]|nr:DegV family protein [Chloroflexota bacterium]